ncbi:MAG: baseplate wedge protein 53 [Proteobacteria bacterium]|nr:baseplate wedge protein 53 [Pseudomonadota bacterium]
MYFEKFPYIQYKNFQNLENASVLSTNILKRIAFTNSLKENTSYFVDYTIKDGETPESIAYDFYGDVGLYWVVLLLNDIINPYYDWPMDMNTLDNYISKKYPSKTFFVSLYDKEADGDSPLFGGQPIFEKFEPGQTIFKTLGEEFDIIGERMHVGDTVRGTIYSWDPQYQRLIVDNINGTGSFAENDIIGVYLADGTFVMMFLERLVDISSEAVHHFEMDTTRPTQSTEYDWVGATGDVITLSSFVKSPMTGVGADPNENDTLANSTDNNPVGDTDNVVDYYETNIGRYMGLTASSQDNQYENVISNRVYEERINEGKRKIKLLLPEFISEVTNEFNGLISGDNPQNLR